MRQVGQMTIERKVMTKISLHNKSYAFVGKYEIELFHSVSPGCQSSDSLYPILFMHILPAFQNHNSFFHISSFFLVSLSLS